MKKLYLGLLVLLCGNVAKSQCPVLVGALVNSCGTEGRNEFVVFTTTASAVAGNYTLYYGSATPAKTAPSAVLTGAKAVPKSDTSGTIISGGCTLIYVGDSATVIPAGSTVILMPASFNGNYNVSNLCTGGTIYIILSDISKTPNSWNVNGSLANTPSAARYLQLVNNTNDCAAGIRSYTNGWATNADGNFVTWDALGTPTYLNGGCDLVTFPVTLTSFSAIASGKNAILNWQTSTEINARSFDLERSADGNKFAQVYTVAAAGNSNTVKNYSYTDLSIPSGSSYYRLKMVDNDGSVRYSKVARVVNSRDGFVITNAYPKPAGSQINISYNAPRAGATTVDVYDFAGRKLISRQLNSISGMNFYQLPLGSLARGTYLLRLEKDGIAQTTEFNKQ